MELCIAQVVTELFEVWALQVLMLDQDLRSVTVKADGKHGLSGIVEQHNLLPLLLNRRLFKNFMNLCASRNKP